MWFLGTRGQLPEDIQRIENTEDELETNTVMMPDDDTGV